MESQSNISPEVASLQTSAQVLAQRCLALEERAKEDRDLADKRYVLKTDIKPVVVLVYGMATTILLSVLGAILTGQIHLPK